MRSELISIPAHGGGKDGVRRSSQAGLLAADRLEEITAQARAMVAAGRGRELMLLPGWWYVITAESFLDRSSEMPDVLELAPKVTCPVLYLRAIRKIRTHTRRRRSSGVPAGRAMWRSCRTATTFMWVGRQRSRSW